jgi:uncharacterized protein YvpB
MEDRKESTVTFKETRLDVPYVSQYKDVTDGDHRLRSCGMVCVYMTLRFFTKDSGESLPSVDTLIEEGMQNGGYGKSGWIHDYFVRFFRDRGYACERKENMREHDVEDMRASILEGNPVIVSVTRRLWDQRLFHMVVLTGVREDEVGGLEGFFYHDPASLRENGSQHLYVALPTFFLDWRKMAIFPKQA